MATIIRMPALSATMETGKLLAWCVAPGDEFAKGQVLAEIETDKAVATIEAPEAGRLIELLVAAGDDEVPVNAELARVQLEGESTDPGPDVAPQPVTAGETQQEEVRTSRGPRRVRASPAARALARRHGIDLEQISAGRPPKRLDRADIDSILTQTSVTATAPGVEPLSAASRPKDRASQMRIAMARALVHAKTTVPHFYAEVDICLDGLVSWRQQAKSTNADSARPTITAYLIRAAALALREVPAANSSWAGDHVQQRDACHIGCAVGLPDRVAVPVIRDADRLTVEQVAESVVRLSRLARSEALTLQDMGNASLTISNLGMHGIDRFFPIINVPEALILGLGQARRVVGVVDDLISVRTMMSCTASVDHRVVDGELLGRFMQAFRRLVENPQRLS